MSFVCLLLSKDLYLPFQCQMVIYLTDKQRNLQRSSWSASRDNGNFLYSLVRFSLLQHIIMLLWLLFDRGPFVTAMGKSWCPDHFICANPRCGNKLMNMGFVEEGGFLYCEKDYELYFAPKCGKCDSSIVGVGSPLSCTEINTSSIKIFSTRIVMISKKKTYIHGGYYLCM